MTSGLPPETDISTPSRHVSKVPITPLQAHLSDSITMKDNTILDICIDAKAGLHRSRVGGDRVVRRRNWSMVNLLVWTSAD